MIPILFAPAATSFNTNGVGRLSDAFTCICRHDRNGIDELEMTYPVDGVHYTDIVHSAIIVAKPSARRERQAFRIYKITKPMLGRVTILAQHIRYQMNFIPVVPFSAPNLTTALAALKSNAVESCPFTLSADFESSSSYALSVPKSMGSCLGGTEGSILDVYGGGEWEFDNYNAILHRSYGRDTGYMIRYGKNLIDLTQEENIQSTYTGVYPFYKTDDALVVLTTEPRAVRAATAANFPFQRTIEKDFTDTFDDTPTEEVLRAAAEAFVAANNIGIPHVSISLDFVNLADVPEYTNLASGNVDLCDLVKVKFEKLNIDVESKIVSTQYDVLRERYTKLEVGAKRASLSDTIVDEMGKLAITPTTAQMHRAVDMATGVLNKGMGGYVIYNRNKDGHPNETLYLDENSGGNLYASQHILRINHAGIGFSDHGYGGPYSQSWDLYGHLTLGGINNSYGDFTILDENAVPVVQMDKKGFVLWNISAKGYMHNGTLYADADLTTPIVPTEGYYYYDVIQRAVYLWDGTAYTAQTGTGGIYARMTRNEGLGVYHGVIDFSWGDGSVGFYADGTKVRIGDFICDNSSYGRAIFQSVDELTGMSAQTGDEDQLYMWVGYYDDDDYVMAVNARGIFTQYDVNIQGTSVLEAINEIKSKVSASTGSYDNDDGYEDYTPPPPDAPTMDHGDWVELLDSEVIDDTEPEP